MFFINSLISNPLFLISIMFLLLSLADTGIIKIPHNSKSLVGLFLCLIYLQTIYLCEDIICVINSFRQP